jgi:hypothetical protein
MRCQHHLHLFEHIKSVRLNGFGECLTGSETDENCDIVTVMNDRIS